MPSVWEGLPVVGVEAQAADLPCVFSDNITREIGLTDKASFVSTSDKKQWVDCLEKALKDQSRKNNYEVITKNRYNIVEEAKNYRKDILNYIGRIYENWYFNTSVYR